MIFDTSFRKFPSTSHSINSPSIMAFKDLLDRFKKGLSRTAKLFDVRSWIGRKVGQDFLDKLEAP